MRLGILGYGNLGKGIECAVRQNADVELKAVFTRRDPATVKIQTAGVPVYHVDEVEAHKECDRFTETDTGVCEVLQCYRQFRYTCQYPTAFCKC